MKVKIFYLAKREKTSEEDALATNLLDNEGN